MTTATNYVDLPALRMDQGIITAALAGAPKPKAGKPRRQTWYGFHTGITGDDVAWGRTANDRMYGLATYRCVVCLPDVTIGTIGDLNEDIVAALGRHLSVGGK